jgi:glycosyltransferase involved in cell wall biosynthesis
MAFRILQIHNKYQIAGGEDSVVANEAELLRSNGHTVDQFLVSNSAIAGLRAKIAAAREVVYSMKSRVAVAEQIAFLRPDIVHVHNTFPRLTPAIYDACDEVNVPVVQTIHNFRLGCVNGLLLRNGNVCEKCWASSPYWGAVHACYRDSYVGSFVAARAISFHRSQDTWNRKIGRFIALTEFAKKKLIDLGIVAQKIVVKGNFVFDRALECADTESSARRGALFVGRFSKEKGIDLLVRAWKEIDYPLTIVGDGPLLAETQASAATHIRFLGQQDSARVRREMRRAAFLVLPSIWYEGFPMVCAEAFAAGLPVLGAAIGGIPELIGDDGGDLFFANSIEDLRRAAIELIHSPARCHQLSGLARARYERLYSPEANYSSLLAIYETVTE